MKEINVAVIGSGSTYCPELIDGFLKASDSLKLKKVAFMDIDERKRTIVGNLCVRMLKNAGSDCEVIFTDDLDTALRGADFVITQIRVGNMTLSVRRPPASAASSRLSAPSPLSSISATG